MLFLGVCSSLTALAIRVLQEDKSLIIYSVRSISSSSHTPATPQGLLESLGCFMVPLGSENFKSWCPSRNAVFKHAFSSKKKLDRNNIPVYKISFGNAFSLEKRLPWRNRWEKFLAFKQLLIKAKACGFIFLKSCWST